MMDFGVDHIGFIVAAYAFTAAVIAALAGYAVLDHGARLAALEKLERGGSRRRAGSSSGPAASARETAP